MFVLRCETRSIRCVTSVLSESLAAILDVAMRTQTLFHSIEINTSELDQNCYEQSKQNSAIANRYLIITNLNRNLSGKRDLWVVTVLAG